MPQNVFAKFKSPMPESENHMRLFNASSMIFIVICALLAGCASESRTVTPTVQPVRVISFGKNGRPHSSGQVGEEYRVVDLLADDIISTLCTPESPDKRVVAFRWEDELIDGQERLHMDDRQRRIIDRYKLALSDRLMATKRLTLLATDRVSVRSEQQESSSFAERGIDMAKELAPDLLLQGKCTVFVYRSNLQLILQSSCVDTKTQAVLYTSEWMCTAPRDAIPEFTVLTGNRVDTRASGDGKLAGGNPPSSSGATPKTGYVVVGNGQYVGWAFANHMIRQGKPLALRELYLSPVSDAVTLEEMRANPDLAWGQNLLNAPLATQSAVGVKGMYAQGVYGIKAVCGSESDPVYYYHRMNRPEPNPGYLFELRIQGNVDGAAPAQLRPSAVVDPAWLGISR